MGNELVAIEFQTSIKNGTIELPTEYRDTVTGTVRVIILAPELRRSSKIIHRILEHPIEDADFTPLKRDDIYQDRIK